ncbi:MAG TPA: hypothetical protein VFX65_05215 [Candidatus Limnocylindrales bacterium]|nr:hypothetical protein [Candidatus Limnocylindrales bacterium]
MRPDLVRVADGPLEVELLPAIGGRLHRLRAFGRDLLRTPDDPVEHARDPFYWGGFVMAPFCNRIAAVPTAVAGRVIRMASNFRDGSAIHGQVYARPWAVGADATMTARGGADGWPWRYATSLRATVEDATLTIEQALTNLDDGPMPAGLGIHPWLRRPLEVRVDAATVVRSNTDPAAAIEPVGDELDLRSRRGLADDVDATWPDPGDPAVELRWPELGIEATLTVASSAGAAIVVASPAGLGAAAIEPQTHLPQGIARLLRGEPGAVELLAPGAVLRLTTTWRFRR